MKPLREEKKRQRLEELETLGQGIIFLLTQMPCVNGWKCWWLQNKQETLVFEMKSLAFVMNFWGKKFCLMMLTKT